MQGINTLTLDDKQLLFQQDMQIIVQQLGLRNPVQLGAGSYGRVYSAQDIDGSYVAIKVQNVQDYQNQEFAAAGILNQIPCNYFTKTHGEKKLGDRVFLAMEFCNMGGLDVTIKKSLMPRASILSGLVHCDIKPANILLTSTDAGIIPKMCDFGETTNIQNIRNLAQISGTGFFFPPEVLELKSNYDQGIDIWSLGLVLYMLATGKPIDHPSYGILRVTGLVLPPELAEYSQPQARAPQTSYQRVSNTDQNEVLLDRNGKKLSETMGKEFVQLLSHMLTYLPSQRHSAAQLLQNFIFTNPRAGNLDIIPNAYGGELGFLGTEYYGIKTCYSRVEVYQNSTRIISSLSSEDPYINYATFEAFYTQLVSLPDEQKDQQILFMLDQHTINSITLQIQRCVLEFQSGSEVSKLSKYAQSVFRGKSQGYIEHDKKQKLESLQLQFSYLISISMDALQQQKNYRFKAKELVADKGLQDLLVGFLDPVYEIKQEYLEALDTTIEFFRPEDVNEHVKKDLILYLSRAASTYSQQNPQITNLAVKILASVAKHGIKLSEGSVSFSVTNNNFAQMMQQVAQGQNPSIPKTEQHPFQLKCERDGADQALMNIFIATIHSLSKYDKVREYMKNPSMMRDPKYDMNLDLSDGTDPEHPEEQLLYTRLACAACIILFHNGKQLLDAHQKAIDTLAEEIYPIRLVQSVANSNIREHRAMLEKRLEDSSIAIVALSYILRIKENHIYSNLNVITGNLEQYINLSAAFPNTDVKNALGLLVTLAQTTSTIHIAALVNGPAVRQVRALQQQKNDVSVIEKLNILDIILAHIQVRMSGPQQMQTSSNLALPQNIAPVQQLFGSINQSPASSLRSTSNPSLNPVQQQFGQQSTIQIGALPSNTVPTQQQFGTSNQTSGLTSNQQFGSYIAPQVNYQQQTFSATGVPQAYPQTPLNFPGVQNRGFTGIQQSGYPNMQQSTFPNVQQSAFPVNQPPTFPNAQNQRYGYQQPQFQQGQQFQQNIGPTQTFGGAPTQTFGGAPTQTFGGGPAQNFGQTQGQQQWQQNQYPGGGNQGQGGQGY